MQVQRAEWWFNAFLAFDAQGRAIPAFLMRVGFGGAHAVQRYQGVSTIRNRLARQRCREFELLHPQPPGVQRWQLRRRQLQEAGLLTEGPEQTVPGFSMNYIDDTAGVSHSQPLLGQLNSSMGKKKTRDSV